MEQSTVTDRQKTCKKGNKHNSKQNEIGCLFQSQTNNTINGLQELNKTNESTVSGQPNPQNAKNSAITSYLSKDEIIKAEIIWTLTSIYYHLSLNTAAKCVESIKLMVKNNFDSSIDKIHLSNDKMAYSIAYSLGPYFCKKNFDNVLDNHSYAISFDESFNTVLQKEQMDLHVRFWNNVAQQTQIKYLGSVFLTHTRAINLLSAFKSQISNFDTKKLIQIAMDGPNVNFKFLEDFKKDVEKEVDETNKLLEAGSCDFKASQWELGEFLKAIFYLFNKSPTRKGDYA